MTRVNVNGHEIEARTDPETIDWFLDQIIRPLCAKKSSEREYVFFAAPPAVGKSTFAAVLEAEAQARDLPFQSIGIDGFHRTNAWLESRPWELEGKRTTMRAIKGAPETFDVQALKDFLDRGRHQNLFWPEYDRLAHDPVPDSKLMDAPVVLVEGNWLLLGEPGWDDLWTRAARNLLVDADPDLLRHRLVERKMRGGSTRSEAERFVDTSDLPNVRRTLQHSTIEHVDFMLRLDPDGIIRKGKLQ